MRVCWQGEQKDRNCGRCEKCIRTVLNFRAVGLGLPECFEQDVNNRQILSLKGLNSVQIAYLDEILSTARAASISDSWVTTLEKCIEQNRKATNGRQGLLQRIRKKVALRSRLRKLMSAAYNLPERKD